jgi:predicted phosphodiesterase
MKIAVASDLHLEFGDLDFDNSNGADVLILSGDIMVANDLVQHDPHRIMGEHYRSNRFHDFFERCCARFPHVIYVLGNHEHYYGDFAKTLGHVRSMLSRLKNLHILEREMVVINGIHFVGGTLWTDMNQEDPLTLYHMTKMMNDFRCVKNSDRVVNYRARVPRDRPMNMTDQEWVDSPINGRTQEVFKTREATFCPEDAVAEFRLTVDYLKLMLETHRDQTFVMCGHHAPSPQSTHAMYAHDTVMNGGYRSDLEQFILDQENLVLWTHGHTHHPFDYEIGQCRVVCNPRGYIGHEPEATNWTLKTIEI